MTATVDTPDFVALTAAHHGKYQLNQAVAHVIGPGVSFGTGSILFSKPGYYFYMTAIMAAAAVNPFVRVDMIWKDSVTGFVLAQEEWVGPAGTAAAIVTRGRGQTKGDQLAVQVTNLDATQNVTINLSVYESTHPAARDDLRSDMNANFSTVGAAQLPAPCATLSNTLFGGIPMIPGAGSEVYVLGLYAGQVNVFELDSGAMPLQLTIQPIQQLGTMSALTPIDEFSGAAAGSLRVLTLPRQPCEVIIGNPNAGAVACTLSITVLELAS